MLLSLGTGAGNEISQMRFPKNFHVMISNSNLDDVRSACLSLLSAGMRKGELYPIVLGDGRGAGSDIEYGMKCLQEGYGKVRKIIKDLETRKSLNCIFLFASVGGGTGSNIHELCEYITEDFQGLTLVPIVLLPFRFEGQSQVDRAARAVELLNKQGHSVTVLDNEAALAGYRRRTGRTSVEEAMSFMDNWVSEWFTLLLVNLARENKARLRFDRQDIDFMWARNGQLSLVGYRRFPAKINLGSDILEHLNFLADVSLKSVKARGSHYSGLIMIRTMRPKLLEQLATATKARYGDKSNLKFFYVEEPHTTPNEVSLTISGFERDQLRPQLSPKHAQMEK